MKYYRKITPVLDRDLGNDDYLAELSLRAHSANGASAVSGWIN